MPGTRLGPSDTRSRHVFVLKEGEKDECDWCGRRNSVHPSKEELSAKSGSSDELASVPADELQLVCQSNNPRKVKAMSDEAFPTETPVDPEPTPEPVPPAATTDAPVPESSKRDGRGRERGELELAVKAVTDALENGSLTLDDGEFLTPHRIATKIKENETRTVSAGAVAAILNKWFEIGYAKLNQKPVAFVGYTEDAFNVGLQGLKDRVKDAKKAARADAKAAAAPAEATAETSPDVPDADAEPAPELADPETAVGEVDETEPPEVTEAPAPGVPPVGEGV